MFSSNTTQVSGGGPDAQFNQVTMLLHGDGTNGAQNNTFVDSSTNNFTITRNGNTTQGSFSPYGSNWSNYFNGSTDYVTFPSNAAFNLGSGDFTIEMWIFKTVTGSQSFLSQAALSISAINQSIGVGTFNDQLSFDVAVGSTYYGFSTAASLTLNAWNHIACVRNGSTLTAYINGTSAGTGSITGSVNSISSPMTVGRLGAFNGYYTTGYLSNVRLVKGTAVYTSNFTPSTTPLTAISGTSLLTCADNRFIDDSTNNFTATANGTPSVQRFNPFGASTAYSTSVIGGSGYFDGSGDGLTSASSSSLDPSATNITVDFWFYPPSVGVNKVLFACGTGATGNIQCLFDSTNGVRFQISGVSGSLNTNYNLNQWNYVVCVKNGTSFTVYVNNVAGNTATLTATSSTTVSIGANSDTSGAYTGYIAGFRYVTGAATTPSSFPTAPPTTTVGSGTVQLLTNFTNGAIFDNAMMNDLETVGALISTSVKKYGTGSIAFDGSNDYLVSNPATTDLYAFGSGNFTIECWLYINNTTGTQIIYDCRPSGGFGNVPTLYLSSGVLNYYADGTDRITGASLSISTWYHVALVRSSGSTKLYLNGTQTGSTYTDANTYVNNVGRPIIGGNANSVGNNSLNGYIDDLRVTKGYARYTANFTPPTAAFSNTGPV